MKLTSACAIILASAALVSTSAAGADGRVQVAFLQGEQLARVSRPGTGPADAIRALIAGPTAGERTEGFRTYLTAGTKLRRLRVSGSVATTDFSDAFAAGPVERRAARLAQVLRTLTGLNGIAKVQILIDGSQPSNFMPDISLAQPVTLHQLQTPNLPVPTPPPLRLPAPDPETKTIQARLIELGYLLPGDNDGRFGPATSDALLAFQKWEGLDRTGRADRRTKARLASAQHPTAVSLGVSGKRAEVLLDRQVALLIKDNRVIRTISVSTGKASTPTPPGNYKVYAKIPRWWSTPFREWLPWALPFVGGIAFHELQEVPAYPASHGCVRQRYTVARWTYAFAYVGMPVAAIAKS
jgi:lipoprotein-anchoring transpeptidase ErfK/SrfK